jgi:hypothetical protein
VLAIYRAPSLVDNACLPFVITGPRPDLILRSRDRLFVWGTPIELITSMQSALKLPLIHLMDGSFAVPERDLSALRAKAKQVRQSKTTYDAVNGSSDGSAQPALNTVSGQTLSGRGSALFKNLSNKVISALSMKKRARFVTPDNRDTSTKAGAKSL